MSEGIKNLEQNVVNDELVAGVVQEMTELLYKRTQLFGQNEQTSAFLNIMNNFIGLTLMEITKEGHEREGYDEFIRMLNDQYEYRMKKKLN